MSESFSIKSNHSERELAFLSREGDDFWVELKGTVSVKLNVYGYCPHSNDLADWFEKLGSYNVPWPDELSWESLEGEFKISVECSSLGHVNFIISLKELPGTHEESRIHVGIQTELGQIKRISNGARKFFEREL